MKPTILLVEDSMTEAFVIKNALSSDYHVVHILDANNVLEDIKRIAPDLILMDIVLPGVSGFHATRTIKSDLAARCIPVIICSSKSIAADRIWARRNGANEYITKPVAKADLLSKVSAFFGGGRVGGQS